MKKVVSSGIPTEVLHAVRSGLKTALPLRLGGVHLLFVGLQVVYFVRFALKPGLDAPAADGAGLVEAAFSLFTLLVWLQCVNIALSASRRARAVVFPGLFFLYLLLLSNHYMTQNPFDYSIVAANWAEAFEIGSLEVIARNIGTREFVVALFLTALVVVLEYKTGAVSRCAQRGPLAPKLTLSLGLYTALIISPAVSYDEMTYFLKSARDYYSPDSPFAVALAAGDYPFVRRTRQPPDAPPAATSPRPDVFLVLLESVNARFVEASTESGREITPFINTLIKRSLYVEKFYANCIQTTRSHFSIFTSILPSLNRKEYASYPHVSFQTLPALLKNNGYETVFFQAQESLDYDHTRDFLQANGFDQVRSVAEYLQDGEKALQRGWGVPDEVFYRGVARFLDQRGKKRDPAPPLFMVLAPIANHEDWSHVAPEQQELYRPPRNLRQSYANSLHLSDRALALFFDLLDTRGYLKASLFVITGDHSYPMDEHGIHYNQCGFYDESFRTPLLLLRDGVIVPERIRDPAYSQLDIAPTIAAAVGIADYTSHFQGVSLIDTPRTARPILMLQPYSGRYLAIYDEPFKYIHHLRSGREFLFNLRDDPDERHDLAADSRFQGALSRLRQGQRQFYLTQRLLDTDHVWPRRAVPATPDSGTQ